MDRFTPTVVGCLLTLAAPLAAGTILVPEECATIQQAILASGDGDTVLVSPGTYVENIHFLGKAITLLSSAGPDSTVIDGSSPINPEMASTVRFVLGEGPDTVLEGFTITGGTGCDIYTPNPTVCYTCGGGVCGYGASPTLRDCRIVGNSAEYGGGCFILLPASGSSGEPTLVEGCVFEENQAENNAGGLMIEGVYNFSASAAVRNSVITGNTSLGLNAGGFLYRIHAPEITSSIIADNLSDLSCGGLEVQRCSLAVVDNCVFAGNAAPDRCVGLCIRWSDTVTVANTILWDNDSLGYDYELYLQNTTALMDYDDIEGGQAGIIHPGGGWVWGEGNLAVNPQFEQGPLSGYHLAQTSPCIDAGDPDPDHGDPEDPENPGMGLWPALGTVRCDMGAYGGGGACWWGGSTGMEESAPGGLPAGTLTCLPNPAGEVVTLHLDRGITPGDRILVTDLSGRVRMEMLPDPAAWSAREVSINLGDLPSGFYMVVLVRQGTASAGARLTVLR
jgi:hypothetical protein